MEKAGFIMAILAIGFLGGNLITEDVHGNKINDCYRKNLTIGQCALENGWALKGEVK